jgi:hypothetical protein
MSVPSDTTLVTVVKEIADIECTMHTMHSMTFPLSTAHPSSLKAENGIKPLCEKQNWSFLMLFFVVPFHLKLKTTSAVLMQAVRRWRVSPFLFLGILSFYNYLNIECLVVC